MKAGKRRRMRPLGRSNSFALRVISARHCFVQNLRRGHDPKHRLLTALPKSSSSADCGAIAGSCCPLWSTQQPSARCSRIAVTYIPGHGSWVDDVGRIYTTGALCAGAKRAGWAGATRISEPDYLMFTRVSFVEVEVPPVISSVPPQPHDLI